MEFSVQIGHVVSFGVGVIVGAFGKFLADWMTDVRKKREHKSESLKSFDAMVGSMPDLVAEMKADFSNDQGIRTVYLLPSNRALLNAGEPAFVYYEEAHTNLRGFFRKLEMKSYVYNITAGNVPKYAVSDEFVDMLKNL